VTGGGHVFVVDDEPGVLDMLRESLELRGYEAITATTGEEAIAAMTAVRP